MRTIERAASFRRDYKREAKGLYRESLDEMLASILWALTNDQLLDARYKDHALIGNFAGYRECHLKPDFLLIYKKSDEHILRLARLGSHSVLFG